MSVLRELQIKVGMIDNAGDQLEGINSQLDGMEVGSVEVQDNISNLGHETKTFGIEGSSAVGEVTGEVDGLEHQSVSLRDRMGGVARSIKSNYLMIGGAIGAAGMAMEGLLRSTQDARYELEVAGFHFNKTTDEMIDMVSAATDATLSQEDYTRAMSRLIEMQVDELDVIDNVIRDLDTLSDATGIDMVEALDLARKAFGSTGDDISQFGEYLDEFYWLQRHTVANLSYVDRALMYHGNELEELGFTMTDIILLFGAMQEAQIEDRNMMRELNTALTDAEGSQKDFYSSLGITNDMLENQAIRLDATRGEVYDAADAYAGTRTIMQEFEQTLQDVNLRMGEIAGEHDWFAPALVGTSAAVLALPQLLKFGAALKVVGGAIIGVIGIIPAIIAGAITTLYLFWTNLEEIRDGITGLLTDDGWLAEIPRLLGRAFQAWEEDLGLIENIANSLEAAFDIDLAGMGQNIMQSLLDGILGMAGKVVDGVKNIGDSIVGGLKGVFGISSPASEMWDMAENVGTTFDAGLERFMPKTIDAPALPGMQLSATQSEPLALERDTRLHDWKPEVEHRFRPEYDYTPAVAGAGNFAPTVNINVTGFTGNAEELAGKIDRRVREIFKDNAERYFSEQRRRRPRKREEEITP